MLSQLCIPKLSSMHFNFFVKVCFVFVSCFKWLTNQVGSCLQILITFNLVARNQIFRLWIIGWNNDSLLDFFLMKRKYFPALLAHFYHVLAICWPSVFHIVGASTHKKDAKQATVLTAFCDLQHNTPLLLFYLEQSRGD